MNSSSCNHSWFTGILVILVFHNEFLFRKIKCFSEREIIRGKKDAVVRLLNCFAEGWSHCNDSRWQQQVLGSLSLPPPQISEATPRASSSLAWGTNVSHLLYQIQKVKGELLRFLLFSLPRWEMVNLTFVSTKLSIFPSACFPCVFPHVLWTRSSGNWVAIPHASGF